jgi:hypothetical protein
MKNTAAYFQVTLGQSRSQMASVTQTMRASRNKPNRIISSTDERIS